MQFKQINLHKIKFIRIAILLILIFITTSILSFINIKSYATNTVYTYSSTSNNLPSDFEAKYPGYKLLLNTLVSEHPNWNFKLLETNLDWNTVLDYESEHGKSLVQPGYYTSDWGCSCGVAYDGPWKCASRAAVEYMMDPRNFLNSYDVFQFQDLSSSSGDETAVRAMISGTFMDTDAHRDECVRGIMEAAQQYSINPYFITSKILQEQGNGTSPLATGVGADINEDGVNEYVGFYNLFNIGAYPTDDAGTLENGLKNAQANNWNSMYTSIMSGAQFIKNDYMSVGQTTAYFQKYNVVNTNNLYNHQYMTNVWGAYSEGRIMRSKYIKYGIYDNTFTFTIPLYAGMPEMKGELARVNADPSLKLKDSPNGAHLLSINLNTIVLITERATSKVGDYYWDKVATPYGTGYMARLASDESKYYLETLTLIAPIETNINTSVNNNFTDPDENNIITTEPNTTVDRIKEKYVNAVILDKNGTEITGDTLIGTGAKIKIDGVEKYTIVKLGDVNGDGRIKATDYMKIKNHIMGISTLTDIEIKAADVNKDTEIKATDYMKIKNHIMSVSLISL